MNTTLDMAGMSSVPNKTQQVVSKKRPKNRKQSGLQAMLARSKAGEPAPVKALNLLDFMKTG